MKLTVKTLQGKTFSLEAQETDTVGRVKSLIEEQQGEAFGAERQKLIHAGKVMKDDSALNEYGVKENDFLVCMVTKPKAPKPAASASTSSSTPATASNTESTTAPPATTSTTPSTQPSQTASEQQAPASQSTATSGTADTSSNTQASDILAGEQLNASVQQLCDMGFPEDQVRLALRAAFNNPDRAVEYLMNGIPSNAGINPTTSTTDTPTTSATQGGAFGEVASSSNPLEALRRHRQFDALRTLVQSNPSALPAVLEQIGSQSPELLRLIHQNQEEFVRMLNEPISNPTSGVTSNPTSTPSSAGGMSGLDGVNPSQIVQMLSSLPPAQQAQMAQMMGMSVEQLQQFSQMMANMPPEEMQRMMGSLGGGGGAPQGAPGSHTIQLTEEEAAAVNRLCDMGFDRNDVIQAYLACEKNEALAANFLMDSMTADMDMGADNSTSGGSGGDSNDDIYG